MKTVKRIIVALLVVYLLGLVFFTIFTFPSTYVNDNKIGMVLKDKAFEDLDENPVLEIVGRENIKDSLSGNDISYKKILVPGQKLEQNQFLWPVEVFAKHNYYPEYEISYDKNGLDKFLNNSNFMANMKEPENARLVPVDGHFEIKEEVEGTTIDKSKAEASILEAFKKGDKSLELTDEYINPEIRKDSPELKDRLEAANKISSMVVTFDMGEDQIDLMGEDLLDLYLASGSEFSPLEDQAYEYVRQLAIEYDTFSPEQEREFKTSKGEDIVVVGGIYGWQIDVEETTNELMEILKEQKSAKIVPTYLVEGLTRSKDDLQDTYIEVSISDQHLWYYKDGQLITETDVVTGDPYRGVSTHTGVGKVWSKERDKTLVGIVPEGSSDYASFVDFWMPINWDNEGIHNSKWRNEFGGSIYQGNGSYGCINLPYDPTKVIFDNVEINTPVVVY